MYKYSILLLLFFLFCSTKANTKYVYVVDTNTIPMNELQTVLSFDTSYFDKEFEQYRLEELPFVDSVSINLHCNNSVCTVLIDIETTPPYDVSYMGGALKSKKHGKESSFPRILLETELRKNNFFGTLSTFAIRGGGLSDRYMKGTWYRPLKPHSSIEFSSEIGHFPSEIEPWTLKIYNRNALKLYLYRTRFLTVTPYLEPSYYRYELIPTASEESYSELVTGINLTYERRDSKLNARSGFYFNGRLHSNMLYPYQLHNKSYRHLTLQYRVAGYLPLLDKRHTLCASIAQNSVLAGDKVPYERLYLGGTKNVRGFETGAFGHETIFENRIDATLAYRFKLFRIPSIKLPFMKWYDKNLKDFPVQVDGGLFLDGGYLWPQLSQFLDRELSYSALSSGLGIRIALPTVKVLGAIDVAVPLYSTVTVDRKPHLHIYVELPF